MMVPSCFLAEQVGLLIIQIKRVSSQTVIHGHLFIVLKRDSRPLWIVQIEAALTTEKGIIN